MGLGDGKSSRQQLERKWTPGVSSDIRDSGFIKFTTGRGE